MPVLVLIGDMDMPVLLIQLPKEFQEGDAIAIQVLGDSLMVYDDNFHFPVTGTEQIPQGIQIPSIVLGEVEFPFQIGMGPFPGDHSLSVQDNLIHESFLLLVELLEAGIVVCTIVDQSVV